MSSDCSRPLTSSSSTASTPEILTQIAAVQGAAGCRGACSCLKSESAYSHGYTQRRERCSREVQREDRRDLARDVRGRDTPMERAYARNRCQRGAIRVEMNYVRVLSCRTRLQCP